LRTPSEFERAYLRTSDPRAQSGFHGSAARWQAARQGIVEAIDRDGTFLDVGCANGLLLESVVEWTPFAIDPYGIDFAPRLVDLARERLPHWRDRFWVADVFVWVPPMTFDFVHARWELGAVDEVRRLGRRAVFSSDGSFQRPDSPRAEAVGELLRERGIDVVGEHYHCSDEHQVELAVAWVDRD
jgi:SAM-dependent methyltransferase